MIMNIKNINEAFRIRHSCLFILKEILSFNKNNQL